MAKPTSKPVHYARVASDRFTCGIFDLEQGRGSINYAPFGIQSFTSVFLLVTTNNVCEVVRPLL